MAVYDGFAGRHRIGAGVAIRQRQASTIFNVGLWLVAAGAVPEIGPGDGYVAELSRAAGIEYAAIEGSDALANGLEARGFKVMQDWLPGATLSCAPETRLDQWRCDLASAGRKASVFWDKEVHAKSPAKVPGSGKRIMETLRDDAKPIDGGANVNWAGFPVLFTDDGKAWGTP